MDFLEGWMLDGEPLSNRKPLNVVLPNTVYWTR